MGDRVIDRYTDIPRLMTLTDMGQVIWGIDKVGNKVVGYEGYTGDNVRLYLDDIHDTIWFYHNCLTTISNSISVEQKQLLEQTINKNIRR